MNTLLLNLMNLITKPIYSVGPRKYIEIDKVVYKIPFRYNRIMCEIPKGNKTLYELVEGDLVSDIQYKKVIWEGDIYKVLKSINTC
jgi:hypothetical protein